MERFKYYQINIECLEWNDRNFTLFAWTTDTMMENFSDDLSGNLDICQVCMNLGPLVPVFTPLNQTADSRDPYKATF
jgi:hypothetical protein